MRRDWIPASWLVALLLWMLVWSLTDRLLPRIAITWLWCAYAVWTFGQREEPFTLNDAIAVLTIGALLGIPGAVFLHFCHCGLMR